MEYRKLPRGGEEVSVLGLGMGGRRGDFRNEAFSCRKAADNAASPFGQAVSRYQCLQYVLDRPGVLTAVPGVRNMQDLEDLLGFANASAEEKDYSIIGSFTAEKLSGNCVYCNHCLPCLRSL